MLTPELDRELPKGTVPSKPLSSHAENLSIKENNQKPDQELPKFKPTWPLKVTIEDALCDIIKEKNGDPLTMEDIEAAAQRANVHYHIALSTLGSMVAKDKIKISKELESQRTRLIEQLTIENMMNWETPEDVSKLIKLLKKETGLSEAGARSAITNIFKKPEYKAWAVQINEYRKEIHLLKLRIRDLEQALKQTKEPVKTETQIKTEHILNLTARISELEKECTTLKKQLQASRKVSLSALQLLHSKNKRFNLYPVNMMHDQEQVQITN
jgi:polyhydroxyalkanoate synthesis regulator phasin